MTKAQAAKMLRDALALLGDNATDEDRDKAHEIIDDVRNVLQYDQLDPD